MPQRDEQIGHNMERKLSPYLRARLSLRQMVRSGFEDLGTKYEKWNKQQLLSEQSRLAGQQRNLPALTEGLGIATIYAQKEIERKIREIEGELKSRERTEKAERKYRTPRSIPSKPSEGVNVVPPGYNEPFPMNEVIQEHLDINASQLEKMKAANTNVLEYPINQSPKEHKLLAAPSRQEEADLLVSYVTGTHEDKQGGSVAKEQGDREVISDKLKVLSNSVADLNTQLGDRNPDQKDKQTTQELFSQAQRLDEKMSELTTDIQASPVYAEGLRTEIIRIVSSLEAELAAYEVGKIQDEYRLNEGTTKFYSNSRRSEAQALSGVVFGTAEDNFTFNPIFFTVQANTVSILATGVNDAKVNGVIVNPGVRVPLLNGSKFRFGLGNDYPYVVLRDASGFYLKREVTNTVPKRNPDQNLVATSIAEAPAFPDDRTALFEKPILESALAPVAEEAERVSAGDVVSVRHLQPKNRVDEKGVLSHDEISKFQLLNPGGILLDGTIKDKSKTPKDWNKALCEDAGTHGAYLGFGGKEVLYAAAVDGMSSARFASETAKIIADTARQVLSNLTNVAIDLAEAKKIFYTLHFSIATQLRKLGPDFVTKPQQPGARVEYEQMVGAAAVFTLQYGDKLFTYGLGDAVISVACLTKKEKVSLVNLTVPDAALRKNPGTGADIPGEFSSSLTRYFVGTSQPGFWMPERVKEYDLASFQNPYGGDGLENAPILAVFTATDGYWDKRNTKKEDLERGLEKLLFSEDQPTDEMIEQFLKDSVEDSFINSEKQGGKADDFYAQVSIQKDKVKEIREARSRRGSALLSGVKSVFNGSGR